jgi:hypothetical protein
MFEWVRAIHDAFNVESTWAFSLLVGMGFALFFGLGGGTVGFIVDKAYRKSEERRLLEMRPGYVDPYVIREGTADFRLDTLDQDLRKVGVRFTSMSSPQLRPTPENDSVPQEYFQLNNGLYLRAQWRSSGRKMPVATRALAERVILAHEARLKAQ